MNRIPTTATLTGDTHERHQPGDAHRDDYALRFFGHTERDHPKGSVEFFDGTAQSRVGSNSKSDVVPAEPAGHRHADDYETHWR